MPILDPREQKATLLAERELMVMLVRRNKRRIRHPFIKQDVKDDAHRRAKQFSDRVAIIDWNIDILESRDTTHPLNRSEL